jgi:hypothetical protein
MRSSFQRLSINLLSRRTREAFLTGAAEAYYQKTTVLSENRTANRKKIDVKTLYPKKVL